MSTTLAEATQRQALSAVQKINASFVDAKSSYEATRGNRFFKAPGDTPSLGAGADYHYAFGNDYYYLLELCRNIARDDKVVGQGLRTFVRNVIQDGFIPTAATDSESINRNLDDRWAAWSTNASATDFLGEFDFHWMEKLGAMAVMTDGDFSSSPLASGQLQQFEAHRMRGPGVPGRDRNIICGVERGADGRRARYWMTKQDYNGLRGATFLQTDLQSFDAFTMDPLTRRLEASFIHVHCPWRLSQTRGVSPLAPVITTTGMHDDVQFAKLVQQQVCSYFAILRNIPEDAPVTVKSDGTLETDPYDGGRQRLVKDLGPGAEYTSRVPGEVITGFSPAVPNPEFFDQSKMLLAFIAANIDLPLMLLLMDASETNFSGWRGAFDQAKIRFRDFQSSYASMWHTPVRRWKVRQWIRQDVELRRAYEVMGERIFAQEWHYPGWPYIEPLKDTQAEVMQLRHCLTSPRRMMKKKGLEHKVVGQECIDDVGFMIEAACRKADEINSRVPGHDVTWQHIYNASPPDNVQTSFAGDQTPNDSGAPSDVAATGNRR